jgi:hypothetical protein
VQEFLNKFPKTVKIFGAFRGLVLQTWAGYVIVNAVSTVQIILLITIVRYQNPSTTVFCSFTTLTKIFYDNIRQHIGHSYFD